MATKKYVDLPAIVTPADTDLICVSQSPFSGNTSKKQTRAQFVTGIGAVTSVNSVTPVLGNVTLPTTNVPEGTNLYFTNARADARANTVFSSKTTDDLTQGATNKYYATSLFNADLATKNTDNLSEGSVNKYYSTLLFNTDFTSKTTDDLTEGSTNKYASTANVQSALIGLSPFMTPWEGAFDSDFPPSNTSQVTRVGSVVTFALSEILAPAITSATIQTTLFLDAPFQSDQIYKWSVPVMDDGVIVDGRVQIDGGVITIGKGPDGGSFTGTSLVGDTGLPENTVLTWISTNDP